MKPIILSIFISFVFVSSLRAQEQNYQEVEAILQANIEAVESWIQSNNLDTLLQLSGLQVSAQEVTVRLILSGKDPAYAYSAWLQLNEDFAANNTLSFDQKIFTKCAHSLGVPYKDLVVKITSEAKRNYRPVVYGSFYYAPTEKRIKRRGFSTRNGVETRIEIPSFLIKDQLQQAGSFTIDYDSMEYQRYLILNEILRNARSYYTAQEGDVEFTEGILSTILTFEVKNIKNEVVPEAGIILPNPHEKLNFTFCLSFDKNQVNIYCSLDGKYGSGFWFLKPSVDYNYTDMAPKYDADLNNYINKNVHALLRSWISE